MRKFLIISFTSFILCCIIGFVELNILEGIEHKNQDESKKILSVAENLVQEGDQNVECNKAENSNVRLTKILANIKETANKNTTTKENKENSPAIAFKLSYIASTTNEKNNVQNAENIIGILKIPSINVEAPIKDGTSLQDMKYAVGHFVESDYWSGNVSLASHNGGTSAHYFEKLNKVQVNDVIEYTTKLGTKKYKVQIIKRIKETDWSMILKSNSNTQNTITLVTCIRGQSKYRLCVRGIEI